MTEAEWLDSEAEARSQELSDRLSQLNDAADRAAISGRNDALTSYWSAIEERI